MQYQSNRKNRREKIRQLRHSQDPSAPLTLKFQGLEKDLRNLAREEPLLIEQINNSLSHLLVSWSYMVTAFNPQPKPVEADSTRLELDDRVEVVISTPLDRDCMVEVVEQES